MIIRSSLAGGTVTFCALVKTLDGNIDNIYNFVIIAQNSIIKYLKNEMSCCNIPPVKSKL